MLEVKNLSVSYYSKSVLTNLEVSFDSGQIHGVLGVNGAGKSTLFNTINRNKKPDVGQILLNGKQILKQDIAYLQTTNFFYPFMKGKEYLQLLAPDADYQKWNDIFGLPLDEFATDYSTGMKKKLAFMGLILRDKQVYILDEPFNGVDIQSNEILIKIIAALKTKGKHILVSSHMLTSLLQMSDQIHHLENGKFKPPVFKREFAQFETDFRQAIDDQLSVKLDKLDF